MTDVQMYDEERTGTCDYAETPPPPLLTPHLSPHASVVPENNNHEEDIKPEHILPVRPNRPVVRHSVLGNRQHNHDSNMLVEAITFTSLGKIQPFLVTINTNAALVLDFHCHLTTSEVVGYLAGTWDLNSLTVVITHAFPCKARLGDFDAAPAVESDILQLIKTMKLTLLGWYHSHPKDPATPTLRDIDTQLDYQLRMRGNTDSSYIPCVGLICSPYCTLNTSLESQLVCYWVAPPPETRIYEYGKPMMMVYSVQCDDHIGYDVLMEIKKCSDFYKSEKDFIPFHRSPNYLEKLKVSLSSKFPRNHTETNPEPLWRYFTDLLEKKSESEILQQIVELASVPRATRPATPELPKLIIPELPTPSVTPPKISPSSSASSSSETPKKSRAGRGKRSFSQRDSTSNSSNSKQQLLTAAAAAAAAANFSNYFVGSDLANALFAANPLIGWGDPTTLSLLNLNPLAAAAAGMFLPPGAYGSGKGDATETGLMKPPPPPSPFYPFASPSVSPSTRRASSHSPQRGSPSGKELKVPKVGAASPSPASSPSLSQ